MKSEWINPFLSAATEVFSSYDLELEIGKPNVQETPYLGKDINVAIGITGDIKGQVVLSVNTEDALGIAQNIAPWKLPEFDEVASSAISELTNILTGRAAFNLEQVGLSTDLSVPTVITGSSIKVFTTGIQNIIIPFELMERESQGAYSGFLSVSMQPG